MPFFGPKKSKHSRTISVHMPETVWARLSRRLQERWVLGRLALCLVAILLLLVSVQSWNAPFPYREVQRARQGILARNDFQVINVKQTALRGKMPGPGHRLSFVITWSAWTRLFPAFRRPWEPSNRPIM